MTGLSTGRRDGGLAAPVLAWRLRLLRTAGVGDEAAGRLAADATADLHALLELVDRGCPPSLAARICAPADGPRP